MHVSANFLGCGCTNGKPFGKVGKACRRATDFEVLLEPPADLPLQFGVAPSPGRQPGRIGPPGGMRVAGRRADRHTPQIGLYEEVRSKFRFESPPRQSGIHSASLCP
jgi:hypothetical protein